MKILLISCYDIDADPPSFYSVFQEYLRLFRQFKEIGWDPYILSDRKNVPMAHLSFRDQLHVLTEIRGKRSRVRIAVQIARHTVRNHGRAIEPSLVFTDSIGSLSDYIHSSGFQAAIHFGGVRDDSHVVNLELARARIPHLFIERGWLPQTGNLYFDPVGTNYRSTLPYSAGRACSSDAVRETRTYLSSIYTSQTSTDGPIVVVLQLENDANNRYFSPFFRSNRYFLKFLSALLAEEDVIFCPHPLEPRLERRPSESKYGDLERPGFRLAPQGGMTIDLIPRARSVIGVNSTVLIEALAYGKPVVAYGKGVFTGNDSVLEADLKTTRGDILSYTPDPHAVDHFLTKLLEVQFPIDDISKLVRKLKDGSDQNGRTARGVERDS